MNLISPRDGEDKKKFCYLEFSSNFVNGKKQQQQFKAILDTRFLDCRWNERKVYRVFRIIESSYSSWGNEDRIKLIIGIFKVSKKNP